MKHSYVCLSRPFLRDYYQNSMDDLDSNLVQHHDSCHCLGTRLVGFALRLIRLLVHLARVDQASAWNRQSYPQ